MIVLVQLTSPIRLVSTIKEVFLHRRKHAPNCGEGSFLVGVPLHILAHGVELENTQEVEENPPEIHFAPQSVLPALEDVGPDEAAFSVLLLFLLVPLSYFGRPDLGEIHMCLAPARGMRPSLLARPIFKAPCAT